MRFLHFFKDNKVPILVLLIILFQNPFWPFWLTGFKISFVLSTLLFLLKLNQSIEVFKKKAGLIILLILVFIIRPFFDGIHFSSLIYISNILVAYTLTTDESIKSLSWLTRIIGLVMVVSFPLWAIHMTVFQLPLFNTIDISAMKSDSLVDANTVMNNFFFFVTNPGVDFFRFYSVFDEPGVLGTLCAFILYANKYDFRKILNWFILLGGVFSFSLVFYILLFIGYIFNQVFINKRIGLSTIVFVVLVIVAYHYLSELEVFQHVIVDRIARGGGMEDRSRVDVNIFFSNYIKSFSAIWGLGSNRLEELYISDTTYKGFLLEYGIVGLVVILITYVSLIKKYTKRTLFLLAIFFLSFIQRNAIFTSWEIFLFTISSNYLAQKSDYTVSLKKNEIA